MNSIVKEDIKAVDVNGVVTDSQGLPIPGVTVMIKGTTTGVATDMDGRYALSVSGPESVLVFSFIGFDPQEFTVGNQSTINVTLTENLANLDEILVVG